MRQLRRNKGLGSTLVEAARPPTNALMKAASCLLVLDHVGAAGRWIMNRLMEAEICFAAPLMSLT